MRRFFLLFMAIALIAIPSLAPAEELMNASMAIFDAFEAMNLQGETEATVFSQEGDWMTAVMRKRETDGLRFYALVYDQTEGGFITWDGLFVDGDAAAQRMADLAEASIYQNAYAENNQITPVPRDNFAVHDGVLTVYYPPEQLSYFSGRAGALSFYAYELEGLLNEDVPLAMGDMSQASAAMLTAFAEGALPGPLADWKIGGAMAEAAEALGLVDVPDLTYDFAVYRFEAPEMRGVSLLSKPAEDDAGTAAISGIYAERIDFSGLITGVSTREACINALSQPDIEYKTETADAYSLRPAGETLKWERDGRALELHFVDGVLQSVLLY